MCTRHLLLSQCCQIHHGTAHSGGGLFSSLRGCCCTVSACCRVLASPSVLVVCRPVQSSGAQIFLSVSRRGHMFVSLLGVWWHFWATGWMNKNQPRCFPEQLRPAASPPALSSTCPASSPALGVAVFFSLATVKGFNSPFQMTHDVEYLSMSLTGHLWNNCGEITVQVSCSFGC